MKTFEEHYGVDRDSETDVAITARDAWNAALKAASTRCEEVAAHDLSGMSAKQTAIYCSKAILNTPLQSPQENQSLAK